MTTPITPDEFRDRMVQAAVPGDPEVSHARMDDLMCETLRSLGYGSGVNVFEDSYKWYA